MPRTLPVLALSTLLLACGGSDGPTEPPGTQDPPPPPVDLGTWRQLASMPVPVDFADGAVHQGRIYVVGGSLKNGALRYDPGADSWSRLPDLPQEVQSVTVRNDTLLAFGSKGIFAWSDTQSAWSAYGQVPQWGELPLVAGTAAGTLITRLGFAAETPVDSAFFRPAGATDWQTTPPVPFGGRTARIQNLSSDGTGIWGIGTESIARYLPSSNRWEAPVATGASARYGCGVATATKVHHFTWPGTLTVHAVYDISARTWSSAAPPPDGQRWAPVCVSIGERVYFIGGNDVTGFNPKASVHVFEF